jgi:lipoprotein-releasing system ATP-binding protein
VTSQAESERAATATAKPGAPIVELESIRKRYNIGRPNEAEVLHGLDLRVDEAEFIALIGPSGSGKSTLLNILGLLERMTAGAYRLRGEDVSALDDAALTLRRRTTLGFVFQFHHLLPAFTALENVTLPALMRDGRVSPAAREQARDLLGSIGLAAAMDKRPGELSGGMQQRVAIARALASNPPLVLADEPTGNLDRASSDDVFALLRRMHLERRTSFVIVTHDPRLAARCDRIVELVDGRIEQDTPNPGSAASAPQGAPAAPAT